MLPVGEPDEMIDEDEAAQQVGQKRGKNLYPSGTIARARVCRVTLRKGAMKHALKETPLAHPLLPGYDQQ